jgi:ABC-2 type transport system permease protein
MERRMADARAAGTIYDLGYQKYDGERLGRGNAIRTLAGYSFRTAFGLGRGERAKAVPFIALALTFIPVFIQVAVAAASGQRGMIDYTQHLQFVAPLLALFAAAQAPELVVTDRQSGVLSLYLSRALRPTDYVLARLTAFTAAMLVLTLGPELVLFTGSVLVSDTPWRAFMEDRGRLLPILGSTVLVALFVAAVALALASLTAKRAYGSAAVIAFFLALPALSAVAQSIVPGDARRYAVLANPLVVMVGFSNWLFDVQSRRGTLLGRAALPGEYFMYVIVAAIVIAVPVLLLRYRRTQV